MIIAPGQAAYMYWHGVNDVYARFQEEARSLANASSSGNYKDFLDLVNNNYEDFQMPESLDSDSSQAISPQSLYLLERQTQDLSQIKAQYELERMWDILRTYAPDVPLPETHSEITSWHRAVRDVTGSPLIWGYGIGFHNGIVDFGNMERQALDMAMRKMHHEERSSDEFIKQMIDELSERYTDLELSDGDKLFFCDLAKRAKEFYMTEFYANFDAAIEELAQNETAKALNEIFKVKGIMSIADKEQVNELKNDLKYIFNQMVAIAEQYIRDNGCIIDPTDSRIENLVENDVIVADLKKLSNNIKIQIQIKGVTYYNWGDLNRAIRGSAADSIKWEIKINGSYSL